MAGHDWIKSFMKEFYFSLRKPEATSIGRPMAINKVQHIETKHKEHVTKTINFFKNKEYELRKNMKCIKKSSTSYRNENAVKASYLPFLYLLANQENLKQ